MDYKNKFNKLINELDEFSKLWIGHYILNFLIGIAAILIIGTVLYLVVSFVTWSFPSLAWFASGSNSFYRILVVVYAFVILMSTFDSNNDYDPY